MRFNSSKLLLDPYAKAIAGRVEWGDEMFGYVVGGKAEDLTRDFRDDAWGMPKAVVIDNAFNWRGDRQNRATAGGVSHLRSARERIYKIVPGRSAGIARHLRRTREHLGDRLF